MGSILTLRLSSMWVVLGTVKEAAYVATLAFEMGCCPPISYRKDSR
jgi:hypothetical protein